MIDSALFQQIAAEVSRTSFAALPEPYLQFAPALGMIVTAITAAIIRHIEKRRILKQHRSEQNKIIQAYLQRDNVEINKIINNLKQNK